MEFIERFTVGLKNEDGIHSGMMEVHYFFGKTCIKSQYAIVAQRPIGLARPQSPAARALRDVASLIFASAREQAVV